MINGTDYFNLEGTVAIVTGASSGLGRHFAKTLAAAGCIVGIAARRADLLAELAAEIAADGGRAFAMPMDVTDPAAITAQLDRLAEAEGVATVLVNNAGLAAYHGFLDAPESETERVFSVNQNAVWSMAQAFSRRLVAAKRRGAIINISSITGLRAAGGTASYAVTKAAVAHMTRIQALDLARHGIRANAIAPGYFDTELNQDFLASEAGIKLTKRIPMRRTGRLEELDGLLLLLASERSAFMTGTVIPVDGGHLVSSL